MSRQSAARFYTTSAPDLLSDYGTTLGWAEQITNSANRASALLHQYYRMARFEEAAAMYRDFADLSTPSFPDANYFYAMTFFQVGQIEESRAALAEAHQKYESWAILAERHKVS